MAKYLLTGTWFYSGVCLALDGFGAAWWHWLRAAGHGRLRGDVVGERTGSRG